jgi:ubiquinone/menaquinone biosynthesis C-methylase UbiE
MTHDDALALIRDASIAAEPATWADLGCGDGTFTLALAELLAKGSTIHAVDRDASALRRLPRAHAGTSIVAHVADFTKPPWPFGELDGMMLANSLHYVGDQPAFIGLCERAMKQPPRFLIVEYDMDKANRWVPYPVGRRRLGQLFAGTGAASIKSLGMRPSIYRRASIYAAMVEREGLTR